MQVLLTTTGTLSNVAINDLGGRTYTHPITDYNILDEYSVEHIRDSYDLQDALNNGYITLKNEFNTNITDLKKITLNQYTIDTNSNNVADDSDKLGGSLPNHYLNRTNHTGTQLATTISDFGATFDNLFENKNLSDLFNVDNVITPLNNYVLKYNSTLGKWEAGSQPTPTIAINDLSDVDTTGVANNYIIKYNSSNSTQIAADSTTLTSGTPQNYYERNAIITAPTTVYTQQTRTLEFPNAFVFILLIASGTGNDKTGGVRQTGSTNNRTITIKNNNVATLTSVTNSNSEIEIIASATSGITFKIIGYIK